MGKEHQGRYKLPYVKRRHGFAGTNASPDEIEADARYALKALAQGVSGVLSLGVRLPAGVLGIDVDAYDGKNGKATLEDWERQFGSLPPTYLITARSDGVSGIRLYRVPEGYYPKEMPNSGVEFLDHHHRYVVVPPSWHHTGKRYTLTFPNGKPSKSGVLPPIDQIPYLPDSYVSGLPVLAPTAGRGDATSSEVAKFAQLYDSGPQADMVQYLLRRVGGGPSVRNAVRDALCWAAREAKGGRYGWNNASEQIQLWAQAQYKARGRQLDVGEFERLVEYAVGQVRDTPESTLRAAWDRTADEK
ncbi:bifunctional DNA primase/polymerase [Mycobacterium sp. DL440]|uniref:bifunctional DNA primase/polymerase n=1 Tax=Mycobacterium sp. DL440 TaxID=2675523 RepID=UPI0014239196|nr:bifunctional DNA primase/polymerase [Mycobacterium sp. DL440]